MNDVDLLRSLTCARDELSDKRCILCGRMATMMGVFVPEARSLPGQPEGKTRIAAYPVCLEHADEKYQCEIEKVLYRGGDRAEVMRPED